MEKMMVVNKAGGRAQESTKARESPERGRERGLLFSQSLAGAHSVKGRAQQAGGQLADKADLVVYPRPRSQRGL